MVEIALERGDSGSLLSEHSLEAAELQLERVIVLVLLPLLHKEGFVEQRLRLLQRFGRLHQISLEVLLELDFGLQSTFRVVVVSLRQRQRMFLTLPSNRIVKTTFSQTSLLLFSLLHVSERELSNRVR